MTFSHGFNHDINKINEQFIRDLDNHAGVSLGVVALRTMVANARYNLACLKESNMRARRNIVALQHEIENNIIKDYQRSPCAKACREEANQLKQIGRLIKEIEQIDQEFCRVYNEYNSSPCAAACKARGAGCDCEADE